MNIFLQIYRFQTDLLNSIRPEFFTFDKILKMREIIEAAWENRSLLEKPETQETIRKVIDQLDGGLLRVA